MPILLPLHIGGFDNFLEKLIDFPRLIDPHQMPRITRLQDMNILPIFIRAPTPLLPFLIFDLFGSMHPKGIFADIIKLGNQAGSIVLPKRKPNFQPTVEH
jgi:hypothetical protein